MRMKFNKSGQLVLVTLASLLIALTLSACATLTVDFVYVSSALAAGTNSYGEIDVFEVNSESGFMRQIPSSPFPSGGRNPVAEAVSSDYANLYVVNKDDNTIVQFVIGNDGKLYAHHTVNTPGIFPIAVTVNGSLLFVADTYEPLATCSDASPCPGSVAVFPVGSDGVLGTAATNADVSGSYWPLLLPSSPANVMTPTSVTTTPSGSYLYVSAYDQTDGGGYVFGFSVGSDGVLTPLNSSVPFAAGTKPSAIAADPSGNYIYVTDATAGKVMSFSVGTGGLLTAVSGSPFTAGNRPLSIAVDTTGKYAYVANAQDSTVTAYSLNSGVMTSLGTFATGLEPVAIGIDPSLNHYLYTANFLGSTVSGFQIQSDGTLYNSQNSPYTSNAQVTAVAAVPHGSQK
jgi:6-phosphogluconolactonase